MELNLLFIIVIAVAFWRGVRGGKHGMASEVTKLISLLVMLVVAALCLMIYESTKSGNVRNIVISVILLVMIGIVFSLLKILLKSWKTVMKLPGLSALDHFLGVITGVAEAIVAFWIFYIIAVTIGGDKLSGQVTHWTAQNILLSKLNEWNYIMRWILSW